MLSIMLREPPTDAACEAILEPINRMRDKDLLKFHLSAYRSSFRVFRRHENPPYTSISFVMDDVPDYISPWKEYDHPHVYDHQSNDGSYFPKYAG
jgi:hypothetical protein